MPVQVMYVVLMVGMASVTIPTPRTRREPDVSGLIGRIVLAVVIAVIVGLLCVLLGGVLITLNVPIAETVGGWLKQYGLVLGVLAGLWYFFTHGGIAP